MPSTIPCGKHTVEHSKLTGSEFRDVCLSGAVFDDCNLDNSQFHNVNLSGTGFDDVNFSRVKISNSNYNGMTIDGILVTDLLATHKRGS